MLRAPKLSALPGFAPMMIATSARRPARSNCFQVSGHAVGSFHVNEVGQDAARAKRYITSAPKAYMRPSHARENACRLSSKLSSGETRAQLRETTQSRNKFNGSPAALLLAR